MGFLALALAAIGISGVFGFVVRQRTREIGVRMALGATSSSVIGLVLASNLRALMAGLGVGILGAAALAGLLSKVLPGIEAFDPAAYAGVILLLGLAVLLAGIAPARRASRIDPVRALRWE
jgi:ABC-type antimicrobial peptide transport system permease subunit